MTEKPVTQKTVLITGCSSGIGYDAALTLRKRGWRVFASCRKPEDCARLQSEGFDSPLLDYESPETITQAVAEVLQATGGTLDAVFNNGAYGVPALVEDIPRDVLRTIFEANLFGVHDLTRQVIPVMRAQGHGRIVNCTSVLGYVAIPWRGAYIATKYALEGLTDTLRLEMRDTPIHVSLIEPGLITTKFGENSGKNFARLIDWQSSARAEDYKVELVPKSTGASRNARMEVPASHVTAKLIHALEAPRPQARYRITKLAQIAYVLKKILPTRGSDWVISRMS